MPSFLKNLTFSQEPVVYVVLANAAIALGVAFGLPFTAEQKAAIDGVIVAGSAVFLRSQVTPTTPPPT